jgi:tetrahydromethanopterin S-methyltransferase subunit G
MEPKDPNKRIEDILKKIKFSFTVPVGTYKFNLPTETVDETIARLDEVDETVDAMTSYPQAKKMLDKLYGML